MSSFGASTPALSGSESCDLHPFWLIGGMALEQPISAAVNESHAFFLLQRQRLLSLPELLVCFGQVGAGGSAGMDGQKNSP